MEGHQDPRFKVAALSAEGDVDVIDSYKVGRARVFVTGDGRYLVSEPPITEAGHTVYEQLMRRLFLSLLPLQQQRDPVSYLERHIWLEAHRQGIVDDVKRNFPEIRYYLVRDIVGYGILDVMMNDDGIEEITIERHDSPAGVIHRRFTEFNILDTNVSFGSADAMNSYIQRLVQKAGSAVTAACPIVNAVTPQGDRITVTYQREVSLPGPTIDIRKFTRRPYTIVHLIRTGALSKLMAAYLWILLDAKAFGLVIGETGSGKTTAINALMCLTNPRWKVITIEDTPELQIPHRRWQRLITRTGLFVSDTSKYDITVMDLIKASLRMRPDFEIVGEVRGEEAFALFQSAGTGHGGLTSFHASGIESAIERISSEPMNIREGQQMLLWFVLHITRMRGRGGRLTRRIKEIHEVVPRPNRRIEIRRLFAFDPNRDGFGPHDPQQLIDKSIRLKEACSLLEINDPLGDIYARIGLLDECIRKDAGSIGEVFDILGRYYSNERTEQGAGIDGHVFRKRTRTGGSIHSGN